MSDFPHNSSISNLPRAILSTASRNCAFAEGLQIIKGSYNNITGVGTANMAYFIPIVVPQKVTVYNMAAWIGATKSGHIDLGVYDEFGNRLVSTGSTEVTTVSELMILSITATPLPPSVYFLAVAMDNGTMTLERQNIGPVIFASSCAQMATAFPLPSTATFAKNINYVPVIGASTVPVM